MELQSSLGSFQHPQLLQKPWGISGTMACSGLRLLSGSAAEAQDIPQIPFGTQVDPSDTGSGTFAYVPSPCRVGQYNIISETPGLGSDHDKGDTDTTPTNHIQGMTTILSML